MRVPLEWLREYIDVGLVSKDLADRLTMAGAEVSAIESHGRSVEGIVVGKIKSIEPHPKNEDLLVVQVDAGSKLIQVITNLKTLKVGDKVPVATVGAKIAKDIRIEKRELHGVESFGMLCSLEHLGLADQSFDVMRLDKNAPLGEDIKNVIGVRGTVLEVDVLPNRGDLLSIIGVAREVSAVLDKKLKVPAFKLKETKTRIESRISVKVEDPDLCPRYMARLIENVRVKESPAWMKDRLVAAGLRPINNIVDVTNYVLLEMGQPLHAFDLEKLSDKKIVVRRARGGEQIVTLDGVTRKLTSETLVIADGKKPVAVAGVMGGANSEVGDATETVLLESACFDTVSVNKTSRALKVRTEASTRFEKGVDFLGVESALDRAAQLIAELSGGGVARGSVDVKKSDHKNNIISLDLPAMEEILGASIPRSASVSILRRLGFKLLPNRTNSVLKVVVPGFRHNDIVREIDVIEEIARIYGYGKIKADMPRITYQQRPEDEKDEVLKSIRGIVKSSGFQETQTFSIVNPKEVDRLPHEKSDPVRDPVRITNPLSEDVSVMRTSLSQSLLSVISRNISRQSRDLAIFEIGHVFLRSGKSVRQELMLSMAITGSIYKGAFSVAGSGDVNLYVIKGAVENMVQELGVKKIMFEIGDSVMLERGMRCAIKLGGAVVGYLGEADRALCRKFDIQSRVHIAEIQLEKILPHVSRDKRYVPLARFPKVLRDIALFVPAGVLHSDIVRVIRETGSPMLESVSLFDSYSGKQVPDGYSGLAYAVDYRDPSRTLTDEEVNARHESVLRALEEKLKVVVRRQ